MAALSSWTRLAAGLTLMALGVAVWAVVMVVLLPFRTLRARACNVFGKTVLRAMVWISGCPVTVTGREHLDGDRPAIYVSNHTSIMDIFLTAWLTPMGTCSIAKKEVIFYPFFGQLYFLSGHFRIDRGNKAKAIASMKAIAERARKHKLSIMLFPEGHRSRDGRMLPFKKGVIHLAVQTGLPVIPIVLTNVHNAWETRSMRLGRVPIQVDVLPPVDTSDWGTEDIEASLAQLEQVFIDALPADQAPAVRSEAA